MATNPLQQHVLSELSHLRAQVDIAIAFAKADFPYNEVDGMPFAESTRYGEFVVGDFRVCRNGANRWDGVYST